MSKILIIKKIEIIVILVFSALFLTSCLFAGEKTPTYSINYLSNDGEVISVDKVEDGKILVKPLDPGLTGYTFIDWYLDGDIYEFNKPVHSNLDINARWGSDSLSNVELDILRLNFKDGDIISKKYLTLFNVGKFTSNIEWNTSNSNIINEEGLVDCLPYEDANVTLTATILNQEYAFNLTVLSQRSIEKKITAAFKQPFVNKNDEFKVKNTKVTTYNINNEVIPYLHVIDFFNLINGVVQTKYLNYSIDSDYKLTVKYDIKDYNNETNTMIYEFDFTNQTVNANNTSFFSYLTNQTATDFSKYITYGTSYVEGDQGATYNLGDYKLNMIHTTYGQNSLLLLPAHYLSTLLSMDSYFSLYYNYETYYGYYFIGPDQPERQTNQTSWINKITMLPEIAVFDYNFLAYTLEYNYGLSNHNSYEILEKRKSSFLSLKETVSTQAIYDTVLLDLDEMHSNYYSGPVLKYGTLLQNYGDRNKKFRNDLTEIKDSLNTRFPGSSSVPGLRVKDNLAIIFFTSFDSSNTDKDTYTFLNNSLKTIKSNYPNVTNILLDISYNTGGNVGALIRLLGFMTDELLTLSTYNPLSGVTTAYGANTTYKAQSNYNWFILTSNVTYSAANLLSSLAKYNNVATILGEKSGGGACSTYAFTFASGTMITLSGNSMLINAKIDKGSIIKDPSNYVIEYGIDVDYSISRQYFYNDEYLQNFINKL